jgi:large subunit ribosomal protein L9
MKIVLLERVDKLGTIGDVVDVKDGFARNFLLPQEKALRATKSNLVRFEAEREFLEARNAEAAAQAQTAGSDLEGSSYVVIRQAGETGILYGSVSSRDIAEMIGGEIKRSMVALEQPIKALGLHDVRVRLHPEVSFNVVINVARTEEEAVRQAAGEDVIQTQMDDDRAQAGEASTERADAAAEMMFEENHGIEISEDAEAPAEEAVAEPVAEAEDTPAED